MRISDWSSDVCSSDLQPAVERADEQLVAPDRDAAVDDVAAGADRALAGDLRIEGPQLLAGRGVPRVDLRPGVADIHHPVDDHRGRFLPARVFEAGIPGDRSEEHTSELQSLMRNHYAIL